MISAFSYGGGVQSTACLVLAARGDIDFPLFIFANVGEDSEHPDTLRYLEEYAKPYAAANSIELVEVRKRRRNGDPDTIVQTIDRWPVGVPIPVHFPESGQGVRNCTIAFKVQPIHQELRRRGATVANPASMGVGISADEWHRRRTDKEGSVVRLVYPLLDLWLTRQQCVGIIEEAGLSVPPKSSCFFCPMHSKRNWIDLKRTNPDLFRMSVRIEETINAKRLAAGKDAVTLHRSGKLLPMAVSDLDQLDMFEEGCDLAGYCHV